jgi:hypothetical protein
MNPGNTPAEHNNPAPANPKPRLRIESSGTIWGDPGTKVYLDDLDITASVYAVTWHIGANENHGDATATVTFHNAEIAAEADLDGDAPVVEDKEPAA